MREEKQQEPYMSSWQTYRHEIRKKIGNTAAITSGEGGNIFIEDQ